MTDSYIPRGQAASAENTAGRRTDLRSRGEPALWSLGGALALGIIMILGFLALVFSNGIATFIPKPIAVVTETGGQVTAGEPFRSESFRPTVEEVATLPPDWQARIKSAGGMVNRTLYRMGNFDVYGEDFRWVADYAVAKREFPANMVFVERMEWGPFIGTVKALTIDGNAQPFKSIEDPVFLQAHQQALDRADDIRDIERGRIGDINHRLENERLALRKQKTPVANSLAVAPIVEVPVAALSIGALAVESDFLVLAIDDLQAYLLAADRDNSAVREYHELAHPAVFETLSRIAKEADRVEKDVILFGESAADPQRLPFYVGAGFRRFSIAPVRLRKLLKVLRRYSAEECRRIAARILEAPRAVDVQRVLVTVETD